MPKFKDLLLIGENIQDYKNKVINGSFPIDLLQCPCTFGLNSVFFGNKSAE